MKKAPVYILLILFLCTAGLYSAEIFDTKDTTNTLEPESKDRRIDLIVIGGFGMAYGTGSWSYDFNPFGPSLALGLEIPFTKAHYFSFEIYSHYWIRSNRETNPGYGTSFVLKGYIGKTSWPVRLSVHIGRFGLSSDPDYSGFDFGAALHIRISNELSISLNQRYLFDINIATGSHCTAPDLLMLNLSYKFKL